MADREEHSVASAAPSTPTVVNPRRRDSPASGRDRAQHRRTPPQASSARAGDVLPYTRVSPYPQRERTPPTNAARSTQASPASPTASAAPHRLQLIVRPIVKRTVGQRDTSGETLDDFAVNGATFKDILHKLWVKFSPHVKGQAMKQGGTWTRGDPVESAWMKVMQFKGNRHLVDSSKTDQAWSRWVTSTHGETVRLLIYEYGMAITKAQDLEAFLDECIRPAFTDRSGAAAESSLRYIAAQLEDVWGVTFQADAVVWRMWANHITRGLDRSTWDREVLDPPPDYIANLLKPADLPAEQQLSGVSRSAIMALDVINAAIEDNRKLKESWAVHGQHLDSQLNQLEARKRTINAFLADIRPPPLDEVIDPLPGMTDLEDIEHQE